METATIVGFYRDRLIRPHGGVEHDSGWRKNLIVLRCRILLAAFLRNEALTLGIRSMLVGRGDPAWDVTPPAAADPLTITRLVDVAYHPIPVANMTLRYLNDVDGVAANPTNRVEITATLGIDEPTPAGAPPFQLREFGLFGEIAGDPFMIDYIRHPLIEKDGAVTLERRVRLIL